MATRPTVALTATFALILAFAAPGPVSAAHAGPLTASCSNPEVGYTVQFPNNWYYNQHVEGGDVADIAACRYFSPNQFSLTPGSEPSGVSIGMGVENIALDEGQGEPVTVGGRSAVRVEEESTTPGFAGTYYVYRIDIGGGRTLVARTSDQWVGDYQENKQILDGMMESLVFAQPPEPTATPSPTPDVTGLPDAAMPAPPATI